MVFSILIIAVLLSIALSIASIFVPKIKLSGEVRRSVNAIYAADSGIEHCLYVNRVGQVPPPVFYNGASYVITPSDCSSTPFTSIGTFRDVVRALEVNFN